MDLVLRYGHMELRQSRELSKLSKIDSQITEGRFDVDQSGFKNQMLEIPLWRQIQEIVANSFDEKSVSEIECEVDSLPSKKGAMITVTIKDNGNGFEDIKDIFTLYKDSYKRVNPEQRGRFNMGEKQFFAVAEYGQVITGNWKVKFHDNVREVSSNPKSEHTEILAVFKKPEDEDAESIIRKMRNLVVPSGKKLFVNNEQVLDKKMIKYFDSSLYTPIAKGKNQKMVLVKRLTTIILYEKTLDEEPILYEMGVPIQTIKGDIRWHISVEQKIPQVVSRNVVSEKYLQSLYTEIVKNTLNLIDDEDSGSVWVEEAMKNSDKQTCTVLLKKQYGTEKIMFESGDERANDKASENGFTLVKGSSIDPSVRKNLLKNHELVQYSSDVFPTTIGDADDVEPTDYMIWYANVVKRVAKYVLGYDITVSFYSLKGSQISAEAGNRNISYNVANLKKKYFKQFNESGVGLLAHELAHLVDDHPCGQRSHMSMSYINSLQQVSGIIGFKGIGYWYS